MWVVEPDPSVLMELLVASILPAGLKLKFNLTIERAWYLKSPQQFPNKNIQWDEPSKRARKTFEFSKNGHIAVDWLYFYELNSKNQWIFAAHAVQARQSFHFQKIVGTLKNYYFLESLQKPSLHIIEQLSKRKLKMGKTFFDLDKRRKNSFESLFIFSLKIN